jgi:streptogramin lyase
MHNDASPASPAIMTRAAAAGLVAIMMSAAPVVASAQCKKGTPTPISETWTAATYTANKAKITIYTGPVDRGSQLQLTAGLDKSLWITDIAAGAITKFSLAGAADTYATPSAGSAPESIAYNGKDVWFTEWQTPCVGSINKAGKIQEYSTGLTKTESTSMTAGLNGYTWFGTDASGIGSISSKGKVNICPIADQSSQITGVTLGPDGNVWWVEYDGTNIGKLMPNCSYVEYNGNMPSGSQGFGITGGPDGRIWYTDTANSRIGAINVDGTGQVFYSTGLTGQPITITAGPDGNLYFGEVTPVVGKITTSGVITEYPFPATEGSFPVINVVAGPDKNIWFTNNVHSQIGKLKLPIK